MRGKCDQITRLFLKIFKGYINDPPDRHIRVTYGSILRDSKDIQGKTGDSGYAPCFEI